MLIIVFTSDLEHDKSIFDKKNIFVIRLVNPCWPS